jgi:hypothetical protein
MLSLVLALATNGCAEDPYGADEESQNATVSVVNKVEDTATIDFCVRGGEAWLGPVAGRLMELPDGLPTTQDSGPLPLAGGTYTARLVYPEFNLCSPSINGEDFPLSVTSGIQYIVTVSGYLMPDTGQDPIHIDVTTKP